jgi:hypothetical protein
VNFVGAFHPAAGKKSPLPGLQSPPSAQGFAGTAHRKVVVAVIVEIAQGRHPCPHGEILDYQIAAGAQIDARKSGNPSGHEIGAADVV